MSSISSLFDLLTFLKLLFLLCLDEAGLGDEAGFIGDEDGFFGRLCESFTFALSNANG